MRFCIAMKEAPVLVLMQWQISGFHQSHSLRDPPLKGETSHGPKWRCFSVFMVRPLSCVRRLGGVFSEHDLEKVVWTFF